MPRRLPRRHFAPRPAPTASMLLLPAPFDGYLAPSGFWAGVAEFDLWYGTRVGEWYWVHLRRKGAQTMALLIFTVEGEEETEFELFDLSRAPVHGLRATLSSAPLLALKRYEALLPVVAIRHADGQSHALTLPRQPTTLPDLWLNDALQRLRTALAPPWQVAELRLAVPPHMLSALWPSWAGEGVPTP